MSKATIKEIEERLYSLDSVYLNELQGALKELKYLSDSPLQLEHGTEKQRRELNEFYTKQLEQKDIGKILKYVMDKTKGNSQFKAFKIIVSEYISNEFNIDKKIKPKCALIGKDGNIFNLMGIVSRTLKENGMREEATEMYNRVMTEAESYDEALIILQDYVEISSEEEMEEEEY